MINNVFHTSARLKRRQITKKEIDDIKNSTPALKKGSSQLFRSLRDKGEPQKIILTEAPIINCTNNFVNFHSQA